MLQNVCFEKNEITHTTDDALATYLRKVNLVTNWKSGVETESKDVFYILDFSKACNRKQRNKFLADIQLVWARVGFFIIDMKKYKNSGIHSVIIRISYFL